MGEALRLISWNICGGKNLQAKVEQILYFYPDLITLQEVTPESAAYIKQNLKGYFIADTLNIDFHEISGMRKGKLGVLVASRWPFSGLSLLERPKLHNIWPDTLLELLQDMFRPERFISVKVESSWGNIELCCAHIPPASSHKPQSNPRGWIKVYMAEAIYQRLAHQSLFPRILCGDLNTPKAEFSNGQYLTWARRNKNGSFNKQRGYNSQLWDQAERKVLSGLADFDLPDTYRLVNGYVRVNDFSYYAGGNGRRYDHIFSSQSLRALECSYIHSLREAKLSDHLPIVAVFEPNAF
jgi:exonuclease III